MNDTMKTCKKCIKAKKFDDPNVQPHSSTRSIHCVFHELTFEELKMALYGNNHEAATRKITLNKLLKLRGSENERFIANTATVVEYVQEVTIKGQIFANYFMIKQLELDASGTRQREETTAMEVDGGEIEVTTTTPSSNHSLPPAITVSPPTIATPSTIPADRLNSDVINNGNMFHRGDLCTTENIFVYGNLASTGRVWSGATINISGDVNVFGDLVAQEYLHLDGNCSATGDVMAGRSMNVTGNMKSGGQISAREDIVVGGNIQSVGEISSGNGISVGGNIQSGGEVSSGNGIFVGGNIQTSAAISAGGNLSVHGDITSSEKVRIGNRLLMSPTSNLISPGVESLPFTGNPEPNDAEAMPVGDVDDPQDSFHFQELLSSIDDIGPDDIGADEVDGGGIDADDGHGNDEDGDGNVEDGDGNDGNVGNSSTSRIQPILFSRQFFYSCMQLIMGGKITTKNKKLPKHERESVFDDYGHQFDNKKQYMVERKIKIACSHSLTDMALTMATSFKNCVVETFEKRAINFLEHLLKLEQKVYKKKE
jgi:cytoskeletal protein CcmA (bactofilin family)